jgi:hypothetical protein
MVPLSSYRPSAWILLSEKFADSDTLHLVEHWTLRVWTGYDPSSYVVTKKISAFAQAWAGMSVDQDALLHGSLWHSAVLLASQQRVKITSPQTLRHHHKALKHLSEDLKKPTQEVPVTTIFAVLLMIIPEASGYVDETRRLDVIRTPFTDWQWLVVHGSAPAVDIHMKALYYLVDSLGGLDAPAMMGFQYAIQYVDLVQSTYQLHKPRYSLCESFREIDVANGRANYFGLAASLGYYSSGTILEIDSHPLVDHLLEHRLDRDVAEVMKDLRVWTQMLRLFSYTNSQLDLSQIVIRRNIIQHSLLTIASQRLHDCSITKSADTSSFARRPRLSALSQLVSTALVIFAISVTFPMTYSPLHLTLALRLQTLLSRNLSVLLDRELDSLLGWLCVIGSLAAARARDDVLRLYFVQNLLQIGHDQKLPWIHGNDMAQGLEQSLGFDESIPTRVWKSFRETYLTPYLWHDEACDAAGKAVLFQVQNLNMSRIKEID